jgi:hypothetical protein
MNATTKMFANVIHRTGAWNTFGIMSAYDKNTMEGNPTLMNRAVEQLKRDVRKMGYSRIFNIDGDYGYPEKSILIVGITKGQMEELSQKYKQESYIHGTRRNATMKDLDLTKGEMLYTMAFIYTDLPTKPKGATDSYTDFINTGDYEKYYSRFSSDPSTKWTFMFFDDVAPDYVHPWKEYVESSRPRNAKKVTDKPEESLATSNKKGEDSEKPSPKVESGLVRFLKQLFLG